MPTLSWPPAQEFHNINDLFWPKILAP